ncbi:MAG: HMA2 domain-containing protein [Nitrospirota bacterium]
MSHSIAGRLRVRIPAKKGDSPYFASLKDQLIKKGGVEQVEANPMTGSVLIIHKLNINSISNYAESHNLFKLMTQKPEATPLSQKVTGAFKGMDKHVKGFTGGELDIPGMAFIVLIGLGLSQISRGNFAAPAWYTAFWYAFNIFLKANDK